MVAPSTSCSRAGSCGRPSTYEFRIDGEAFHVRVRDGDEGERVEAKQGSVPDPDLIVTGDAETFLAVASGRLSPEEAVQSGALKVSRSVSSRSVEEKTSRVFLALGGP